MPDAKNEWSLDDDALTPDSSSGEIIAYVIERLVEKLGAPSWYKAESLGDALEWALAEVQDTGVEISLLENLTVDKTAGRIVVDSAAE